MGFLSNMLGGPAPVVDPTCGDAALKRARQDLWTGKFDAARDLLAQQVDPNLRAFRIMMLGEWKTRNRGIEEWMRSQPDDSNAWTVGGALLLQLAWVARGSGTADTVTTQGAQQFVERLATADEYFARAAQLNHRDPVPHALAVTAAMGLGYPEPAVRERFEAATAIEPMLYTAHGRMLTRLLEKWGGSHEKAFAFARDSVRHAPNGSAMLGVLAEAHYERWVYAAAFDPKNDPIGAKNYWKLPQVQSEMRALVDRFLQSPDVSSPDVQRTGNFLACCMCHMDDHTRAAKVFDVLGDRVTEYPWAQHGDEPGKVFARWRRDANKRAV